MLFVLALSIALWPMQLLAQSSPPDPTTSSAISSSAPETPAHWYVLAAGFALLVPAGLMLMGAAGLEAERAWNAVLGGLASVSLASLGYWAFGFALQFGGVGLVYPEAGLRDLVWEWSPFSADWGVGWGVAGLSGWFLSSSDVTALAYTLFLAHLPWAMTAALLPLVALRGRAPATATLVLAPIIGGVLYPLAENWVRGGGWLGALGNNLMLGHGFVDFGGAGTVYLVAAGVALAALVVWVPRRPPRPLSEVTLPPVHLPIMAVLGSVLLVAGSLGWLWSNPLQMMSLDETALLRGSVNSILFACGGLIVPLVYTWFVTGASDPLMSARGLAAGAITGLATAPFVTPGVAFFGGLVAGATVPFVTFIVDDLLRLDDSTGSLSISGLPAILGLLVVGIFADGSTGVGWQRTGIDQYLGVVGQGVSGLFVGRGYQPDFPGQLQAQVIGILTLALWGFVAGLVLCAPLGLMLYYLRRGGASTARQSQLAKSELS